MNDNESSADAPSNHDVANFLRDEGYYDPLLSEQEMYDLYQALSNSKNTASAEDEKRRTTTEATDDCDMLDDLRLNSVPVNRDDLKGVGSDKSDVSTGSKGTSALRSFENDNFDDLDIFNSVPTNHPPLTRISYVPKYNPPLYCNPKFNSLSLDKRKQLMLLYHKKLIDIYDSNQRKSLSYAPLSEPISSDSNFNRSWVMDESTSHGNGFEDEYNFQDDNSNEIYISRSGRQTKRKLYTEHRGEEKKSKLSCKTVSKKKIDSDLNEDSKNQIGPAVEGKKNRSEKLYDNLKVTEKKQEELKKEADSFFDSLQVVSDDEDLFQDDTYTSRSGRQTKKKIYSEDEEEKKSNILQGFKWQSKKKIDNNSSQDSKNGTPPSEKRKNRSEKLFDDLLETEKVGKVQKKGEHLIHNSLQVVSDDEEVETVHVEEPFIRRRIVPPLRGGRKNTGRQNLQTRKNPAKNKSSNAILEPLQSSSSHVFSDLSQEDTYGVCPMCDLHFPTSKLEKHASECIDLFEKNKSTVSSRTITCEKCDLVMPFSTNYEVHVRECLTMSSKAT